MPMISNLSDGIAAALRSDLTSGRWGAGMALPSVDDLRERFCAGEYAVRRALKQLRDEGFITLRQRVGAVATEKASQAWKGTVAFVHVGAVGSYYSHRLAQQLQIDRVLQLLAVVVGLKRDYRIANAVVVEVPLVVGVVVAVTLPLVTCTFVK